MNWRMNWRRGLLLASLIFLSVACEDKNTQPQPTPAPSATPFPTPIEKPTPDITPKPSATPVPLPSATPNPTPSPSPTPTASPRPFDVGVCIHLDSSSKLRQIADMGAKWVRIDVNWYQVQPDASTFDFSEIDLVVREARRQGLKVFATLAYTPAWASTNGKTDGTGVPEVSAWKKFVATAVRHLKKDVQHFGLWNEPNLDLFWSGTAKQYVDTVLRPGYEAVKGVDPQIFVLGPDLAHLYNSTIPMGDFWKAIREGNCLNCFDLISHHIYGGNDFEQKLMGYSVAGVVYKDGLKQMLEKNKLWGRSVWLTEIGVDSAKTGEAEQEKLIVNQLEILRNQPWIKSAFIYELTDDPNTGWGYGLVRRDGSVRPYYYGVQNFISKLPK